MDPISYSRVMLLVVYVFLLFVDLLALLVYWWAYFQMKRTPMILSVALLLSSLFLSDFYFMLYQVSLLHDSVLGILQIPYLWAIPKLFVLAGLIYFLRMSFTAEKKKIR